MNLANICIKRPVFTLMINLCLIVLGIFSYSELGLDLFPKMDYPNVRIQASYPGASPEEMESEIVRLIEEAVNTVGGIDTMSSRCEFGTCNVMVAFALEKDIDVATQEVRDKIARVAKKLPDGVDPPSVEKIDPDSSPIITLIVSSDMPMRELTFFAKKRIKEPLETIEGVGAIQVVGEKNREIQVVLDAQRLASLNITSEQVKESLKNQNLEVPGGNVTDGDDEFVLRNMGRIRDPRNFANIIVAEREGKLVRVSDIGTVIDGIEEQRSLARLDGKACLSLTIQKQSGCNTLDVINRIKSRVHDLQKSYPSDLKIVYIRDQSEFIKASMHELNLHLVLGSLLASLVVFIFMGNIVPTLIAALAIPVSLISTFLFMKMMGFTLNNMTMLGMTLAVGIVIDDAIVVLENIFRHMEELGSDAVTAASEATSEISLAVLATSLSLAIIFLPLVFIYGIIGNLLNNFGLTIAFSILVSIFVSFTLTPMLCSQLFKYKIARGHGNSKSSWFFTIIDRVYTSLLRFSLRRRWVIVFIAICCLVSVIPLARVIRTDFLPPDDAGEYTVSFRTEEGRSMTGTERTLLAIEEKMRALPGVQHVFCTVGEGGSPKVNEGGVFVQLIDLAKRKFTQFDSMAEARKIMKAYPDYRPSVQNGGVQVMAGGRADLQFFVRGPELDKLREYTDGIIEKLRKSPIFGNVNTSFIDRKPEIHVKVDRDRAFQAGIRVDTVFQTLKTLVGGADQINQYLEGGEQYEVRTRLRLEDRKNIQVVSGLLLPLPNGNRVRLDTLASISTGFGPAQINRQDRQRSISVTANLGKDKGLGEANVFIMKTIREMNLPPEYSFGFSGKAKEMERTSAGFQRAFFMSAIFMFMILASQFESLLHPFTIMLSLPLSIPFALLSLLIMGSTLNVYSALGVFMLFGIVKKNAILQIDYTNTLREKGIERDVAVLEANRARFRPILMTTITLVAGMLPMALGTGPGAATRASMAIVIIGGQSLCLLITLLLTPVAYTIFDDMMGWMRSKMPTLKT
ncbi:MAG: efflux RND transporter permease subunit [Candidatus Ozemobacteraceae bacterium]